MGWPKLPQPRLLMAEPGERSPEAGGDSRRPRTRVARAGAASTILPAPGLRLQVGIKRGAAAGGSWCWLPPSGAGAGAEPRCCLHRSSCSRGRFLNPV